MFQHQRKLVGSQIKNAVERLSREIKLEMHFKTEPTVVLSEKPAFRKPSKWTPSVRDVQLKMNLIETEERLLSINERRKSYPNLRKR